MSDQTFHELFTSARTELGYKVDGVIVEITEQIKDRMKAEGISKSELADKIKVSAPYITKLLRGETNFTAESIVKIADALSCGVEIKLVPKTNVNGWVDLFGKTIEPRREFQVWVQEARTYRNEMKSFDCTTSSQAFFHESH